MKGNTHMAQADPHTIHYLVGTADEPVSHIYAVDQEAAVKAFVNGENYNGDEAEEFYGEDVIIVAYSKVQVYAVETVEPVKLEIKLRKVERGS